MFFDRSGFHRPEEHDHEVVILDMMAAFAQPFHGIQFGIPDDRYYQTQDGLSWGVNPPYTHAWNGSGESEVRLQDQPPRNADPANGAPGAMRTELFQAVALCAR